MNVYLTRAQLLMQQDRHELAEEQLRLALGEGTDTAVAHALLALCLVDRKQFDEATAEAHQAIHEAPDEELGFYALAAVQFQRDRLDEAKEAIEEAIRLEPEDPQNFSLLASIEAGRYRWADSLAAAEQGLALDPDHITCNNCRARALVKLGRAEEAGQTIDAALAKNPENAFSHATQGWTLLHQRRPHDAMIHFREALRLEPNLEWARLGIIEAMKARFFLYRWLLVWFLWLGRIPPRFQLALILGIVLGQTLLNNLIQSVPVLAPFTSVITILYCLFVWMAWTSSSLFNLVLRLDPFGRMALSPSERLESTMMGVCVIVGLTCGSSAFFFDREIFRLPMYGGLLYLGLMVPLAATFAQHESRRKWFAAYTAGVAVCVVTATWKIFGFCALATWPPATGIVRDVKTQELKLPAAFVLEMKDAAKSAGKWLSYSTTGIAISTWIGAASALRPVRH